LQTNPHFEVTHSFICCPKPGWPVDLFEKWENPSGQGKIPLTVDRMRIGLGSSKAIDPLQWNGKALDLGEI
jgi:hypothetical protein